MTTNALQQWLVNADTAWKHDQKWLVAKVEHADELLREIAAELTMCRAVCARLQEEKQIRESRSPDGEVEIVVNGQPVQVAAGPIRDAISEAIHKSGQIGAPIDQWVLRTREGDVIPHQLPDGRDYALVGGQRLFMHLGLPRSGPADFYRIQKLEAQVTTLTAALRRQIDEWYRRAGEYRREEQEASNGFLDPSTPYRLQAEKYEKCADELAAVLRAASEGAP